MGKQRCYACGGTGLVYCPNVKEDCPVCDGKGYVEEADYGFQGADPEEVRVEFEIDRRMEEEG